MVQTYQIKTL